MAERKHIMLAHKLTEKKWQALTKPAIVQPKYNGNRCRVIFDGNGNPHLRSSSDAPITSVDHLKPQLKALSMMNIELDGELYIHGMPHQDINGIVRRTNTVHVDAGRIQYHIYDFPNDNLKQFERIAVLNNIKVRIRQIKTPHLFISPHYYVETFQDVLEYLSQFIMYGYEGIIIRDLNAYYIRKKCSSMLKFKLDKSELFDIIGVTAGITKVCKVCHQTPSKCGCIEKNIIEEPSGLLGAIECITKEGYKFNIGSGPFLTKENRLKFNDNTLIGMTAVAKFHEKSIEGKPKSCVLIDVIK